MAVINQYKATYPSTVNNFESDSHYINATSMEKAVEMATLQYGKEPTICTKIRENVLTEVTSSTTVNFQIKSYYIDEDTQQEIEVSKCVAYPTSIPNATRGNTVYLSSPNYTFTEMINEDEITITYTFEKWVIVNEEFTDNPHEYVIPLDESVTDIIIKAIYTKE